MSWAQWKTNMYNCQCLRALLIPTAFRKCLMNVEQRPTYPQQLVDNLPESMPYCDAQPTNYCFSFRGEEIEDHVATPKLCCKFPR